MRYSDPTANTALGAVSREWKAMLKLAVAVRQKEGTPWAEAQLPRFTGIYRRFLTDPLEDLLEEMRGGH
ncbi:MAG: hypothetical protein IJ246_03470 [Clostridia bacterium]|nr:hypothetical protein [Clostridia bacterium]